LASNQHYQLPATNQWFALAGRQRFPWGSNPAALAGNYSGQEATQINWPAQWPVIGWHVDEYPRTAPVTSLGTNRLGLYHLGGNVAEWCMEKVLCGRSWADGESDDAKEDLQPLEYLETSRVQFREPSERNDRNGFRIMICEETEGSAH
ncbi:MAG TPA: SUMF1/EgtB/PvdO family nonheme iron enzyme, partial [Bacillota bacterium]|nr:SUMF1/EgtB/PvdO family nonheme iron enzyme [Bacillota bacterium]